MDCFCYMQHIHCHNISVRRFTWSQEEYLRIRLYDQMAWHDLNSSDMVPIWLPNSIRTNIKNYLLVIPLMPAHLVSFQNYCMLGAMTASQQQDHALRFHTDCVRKDESQGHLSCLWVVLSLRGDRKCVLWHLATSSWIISTFWEDTGFITASVPTPSDATPSMTCETPPGELWQAACVGQATNN